MVEGHITEPNLQGCHWTARPESVPAGSQEGLTGPALCLGSFLLWKAEPGYSPASTVSFALSLVQGIFFFPGKETKASVL